MHEIEGPMVERELQLGRHVQGQLEQHGQHVQQVVGGLYLLFGFQFKMLRFKLYPQN